MLLRFLLLIFVTVPSVKSAFAQNAFTEPSLFRKSLGQLAQRLKASIIVEGTALHPNAFAPEIKAALESGHSPQKSLNLFAGLHDYSTQRVGSVYVLNKKYTQKLDIPCVTIGELVKASVDTRMLLKSLMPSPGENIGEFLSAFLDSLQNSQWKVLSSAVGLEVNSLNETQLQRWAVLTGNMVWGGVSSQSFMGDAILRNADTGILIPKTFSGQEIVAYKGERSDSMPPVVLPLQRTSFRMRDNESEQPLPKEISEEKWVRLEDQLRLAGLQSQVIFSEELRDKPGLIINPQFANKEQIARGIAALYGLRVRNRAGETLTLERQTFRAVPPSQIQTTLAQILPLPVRTAFQNRRFASDAQRYLQNMAVMISKSKSKSIPVSGLDVREKAALGLFLTNDFLAELADSTARRLPLYVRQTEKINLFLQKMGALTQFSIRTPDGNGGFRQVGGITTSRKITIP